MSCCRCDMIGLMDGWKQIKFDLVKRGVWLIGWGVAGILESHSFIKVKQLQVDSAFQFIRIKEHSATPSFPFSLDLLCHKKTDENFLLPPFSHNVMFFHVLYTNFTPKNEKSTSFTHCHVISNLYMTFFLPKNNSN